MNRNVVSLMSLFICKSIFPILCESLNPDKEIKDIINGDGYPFQVYDLKTKDGYYLKIHRIPGAAGEKIDQSRKNKPIAFLLHPLTQSSINWVAVGLNPSLAYLLADNGFDVWLGNNRGTLFGQKHESLMPSSASFWNFSWHECGMYDLPETIDFILNQTRKTELSFVCYSHSCTELNVMASLIPEYNKKINLAVNMAPVVFMGNIKGIGRPMGLITAHFLSGILEFTGHFGLIVSPLLSMFTSFLYNTKILKILGFFVLYSFLGFSQKTPDMAVVKSEIPYTPGGMSSKQLIHYCYGIINPGTFRQYDYGKIANLRKYNSRIPPDYPLEKVTIPMAFFNGLNDFLANPKDVELLIKKLPNVVYRHAEPGFNHVDFFWAKNIRSIINEKILYLLINIGNNETCIKQ